ncbi:MAG: C39 family peptidase [Faecousia sp.]
MKKTQFAGLLLTAGLLLGVLTGCGDTPAETKAVPETTGATEAAVLATVPPDGDPNDVTCKGSYTGEPKADAVAASMGNAQLTNGQLQAFYWAEVAAYRQAGQEPAPDFDLPLDTQACDIDDTVASWQQYFLRQALNTWCSAQALVLQGQDEGLPTEEAYKPNLANHEKYLSEELPALKYLYGYSKSYQPNTLHQAYLDTIPDMLEQLAGEKGYADASDMALEAFGTSLEDLEAVTALYNRGYMYFTSLGYYIETAQEEVETYFAAREAEYAEAGITGSSGSYVDIRHILLIPQEITLEDGTVETVSVAADGKVTCSEEAWEACRERAETLLSSWQSDRNASEATFAELAYQFDESGSRLNGGAYRQLRQGQLMKTLDAWCFEESRQSGDTVILRSDYGYHILYFSGSTQIWYAEAEKDLQAEKQAELITAAREKYPARIDYSAITLTEAAGTVCGSDVLYPDVAHERFPEVPLYLQQDYEGTWYGGNLLSTTGCGITSFAMVASYLADDELTPPEMCARYGKYGSARGTDGTMFNKESSGLGFFLREKTYDPEVAKMALQEGYVVISVHRSGYWTRAGHYIVVEKMNEDGTVQVRDSNIYNYGRVSGHMEDKHTWLSVTGSSLGYWIFERKVVRIPACSRCGEPEGVLDSLLEADYTCEKCHAALLRRDTYLSACGK